MKQTIGDLWDRFTNKTNWRMEPRHLAKEAAALDQFVRVLEIDGYVIAIEEGIDDEAGGVGWKWSIYRGKAEWYSYLVEAVWTPVNYADENEARAAAWSTLVRISAGPEWPHEPAVRTFDDVFEFPEDKAEREARAAKLQ